MIYQASLQDDGTRSSPGLFVATGAYLTLCLVLGGASQANDGFDLILRLAGVPLLSAACYRLLAGRAPGPSWPAFGLLGALILLPALQLIPLPPGLWAALPGRAELAADLSMAGVAPVWRPLSLTPEATLDALFGVVPFAAVLMAAACLSPHQRQRLWVGTAILAFASVALGALQLASGGLRLYGDRGGAAVGFFANRNHWAVWLAASLPILAFVMSRSSSRDGRMAPLAVAILLATFVALLAGVAISGSRAGAVLLAPAVVGSVFLLWRQGGRGAGARRFLLPAAAAAAGLIFAILGTWVAASRFAGAGEDLRFDLWANAFSLALAHLPFGAGGGSFSAVYMGQETADALTAGFVNQAHNDWVEIFVEYGVAAILPMVLAAIVVVRGARRDSAAPFIILALALLLAASIVDYPLRTPALQALTGLLLAGLAPAGAGGLRRST